MNSKKVGLALSGGGFRASFFHIGVLSRLAELDLLHEVEVISTVSGGSIVGALFYLHLKQLLEQKNDADIRKEDYEEILKRIEADFLKAVQKNIRMRVFGNLLSNFRMFSKSYSRSDRIGELYAKHFYKPVLNKSKISMSDLKVQPKDGPENFHPYKHNKDRRCKAPILVLNATTLNTGHNWQFTATWMGEPPSTNTDVDKNTRLRRLYYNEAYEERHKHFPMGAAVAASACVPGLFHPLPITNLYEEVTVQLVDGGVHDNQGVISLLQEKCTYIICSDSSCQIGYYPDPKTNIFSSLLRSNSILMDRVREEEISAFEPRLNATSISEFVLLHLKKDLVQPEKTWIGGSNKPDQILVANGQTDYGVDRRVQALLAEIRTDLDSFTEVEAYSLMGSGYLMAEKEFDDGLTKKITSTSKAEQTSNLDWRFLQAKKYLQAPDQSKKYLKQLEAGKSLFFKALQLVPALKVASIILLITVGVGLAYFLWVNRLKPVPMPSATKTYGSLALAILILAIGMIPQVKAIQKARNFFKDLIKKLFIAVFGFIVVWFQLIFIDPLFLRQGRISKLK
jgi:predicted acylesterase/phospholipase RssA